LLIGTYVWNKLSEQEQEWLSASVKESVKYQRMLWAEAEAEALREVQKAGVQIIRPDKSLFAEKVKGIFEGYKQDAEIYPLIQQILETN
jgi:TRAP-type C4-dicarboxylate transport system substrate-binding protein